MAEWRPFGATNKDRTCLWCGDPLRPHRKWAGPGMIDTARIAAGEARPLGEITGYGYSGGNQFCGLRCGFMFAEALAGHGRRLKPTEQEAAGG